MCSDEHPVAKPSSASPEADAHRQRRHEIAQQRREACRSRHSASHPLDAHVSSQTSSRSDIHHIHCIPFFPHRGQGFALPQSPAWRPGLRRTRRRSTPSSTHLRSRPDLLGRLGSPGNDIEAFVGGRTGVDASACPPVDNRLRSPPDVEASRWRGSRNQIDS